MDGTMVSCYEIARSLVARIALPGKQCSTYLMMRQLMVSAPK